MIRADWFKALHHLAPFFWHDCLLKGDNLNKIFVFTWLFIILLFPQVAFALGKTANIVTCNPQGRVTIETMVYDTANGQNFKDVPQHHGRNFFYLTRQLKSKLSDSLVSGHVVRLETRNQFALMGYMQDGYDGPQLPNKPRSRTETWEENRPGTLKMDIEGTTISCDFAIRDRLPTKVSVTFHYDDQTEHKRFCHGVSGVRSYNVEWFLDKDDTPVKSESILASCGNSKGSVPYDVSVARISAMGRVDVDLKRTQTLHKADGELLYRHMEFLRKRISP